MAAKVYTVEIKECWIRRYANILAYSKEAACSLVERALEGQKDIGPSTMEFDSIISTKAKVGRIVDLHNLHKI